MTGSRIPKKFESIREANDKWRCKNTLPSKLNGTIVPPLVREFERQIKASRKPMTGRQIPEKFESIREANDKWRCQNTLQSRSNDTIVLPLVREFERQIKASRKPMTGFRIPKKFESIREDNDIWRCKNTLQSKFNGRIVPPIVREFERQTKASRKPMTGLQIPEKFESIRGAND